MNLTYACTKKKKKTWMITTFNDLIPDTESDFKSDKGKPKLQE